MQERGFIHSVYREPEQMPSPKKRDPFSPQRLRSPHPVDPSRFSPFASDRPPVRPDHLPCCSQCEGIEAEFDRRLAERELRRFRRRGPTKSTRLLLADLAAAVTLDSTLLDIGGGIGAIHHLMLDAGAVSAVQVDASSAYIVAARDEATQRRHLEAVEFAQGDFVTLAPSIAPADIVTLDRVICCYPDMPALVGTAADKALLVLGAVYPPDVWWIRIAAKCVNYVMRLRESSFRVFVHSTDALDAELKKHGLERATRQRTIAWEIATYRRTERPVDR